MPPEATAHRVISGVVPVAAQRRQVDAADERDLAVDDDQLLVMAVHWALAGIERDPHARAAKELVAHLPNGATARREDGQRCPGPQQHPDIHAFSQLAEQIAKARCAIVTREPETGSHVPPGDVDVRAAARERPSDARQSLSAVYQNLERAPGPRRRITTRHREPSSGGSSWASRPTLRSRRR